MPDLIKPNRLMVDDRFSVLGFTIRADAPVKWFEVALGTDPQLFRAEAKSKRTPANFYSSRAAGPLVIERGEAVYLIPTEVLARFVGGQKLYYALATFPDSNRSQIQIAGMPTESSPWIDIKAFTGRALRRVRGVPSRHGMNGGYPNGNAAALEWAGDAALPGMQPVNGSSNGAQAPAPATPSPNGQQAATAPAAQAMNARGGRHAIEYDDGFDDSFWSKIQEAQGQVDESDAKGIEGPIPDAVAPSTPQSYSYPLQASEYPQASRFVPAAAENYSAMSNARTINRVVIHITDGGSNINGTIAWFQNPQAHVSAHYVIGQNGEVVQMVKHNDKAWHARSANRDSIGIEHVANTKGLMPTEAEYCASAALVRWLCEQYSIPMNRDHILGHAEADTGTTHTGCPNAVWDWDYFMGLVTSATCYPRAAAEQSLAYNGNGYPRQNHGYGAAQNAYLSPRARALDESMLAPGDVVKAGGKTYVIYATEVRSGGVWAWINNNPGNITAGKWAEDHGAYPGRKNGGFAIFPDEGTGFYAIIAFIERAPEKNIYQVMTIYAPPDDGKNPMLKGNNPEAYAASIARKLGVPVTTQIKDLSDEQKAVFATEVQRIETGPNGAGRIYSFDDPDLPEEIRRRLPVAASESQPQPDAGSQGLGFGLSRGSLTSAGLAARRYAGALALMPMAGDAVDRLRAEYVANAAAGANRRNCINILNDAVRQLYGAALQNPDGSNRALGSTVQGTMAALQNYGLAQAEEIFQFNDAHGRLTKGVARPETLRASVEAWLLSQAEANAASAWYCFGLSIMDGYHSVVLALQFSGTGDPSTKIYWADQIFGGWDDVTGRLDARITERTQTWWDPLPADKKAKTRVTVWPLA